VECVLVAAGRGCWREVTAIHEATATAAYAHIFSEPFPLGEAHERWRTYEGQVLLATIDEIAVGFAAWSGRMLDALYVLPEHAGRGMGTRLLSAVPASVESLWVLLDNARGRAFYERNGWFDTGVVRPAYEPVHEVLYQRWNRSTDASCPDVSTAFAQ
jgi:GNAT superfamily N-acetyltransferase